MLMRLMPLCLLMATVLSKPLAPSLHVEVSISEIFTKMLSGSELFNEDVSSGANLLENGRYHEGDIMRSSSSYSTSGGHSRRKRSTMRYDVEYWKDGVVPILIKYDSFDDDEIEIITKSIKKIEDHTCIRFPKKRKKDKSYVELRGDLGEGECWSYLGRQGGNQTLSLGDGCVIYHYVLHEMLHALGFVHQHSSPDRDRYIKIHWSNIDSSSKFSGWFDKYDWNEFDDFGLGYDYYSVMHYSAYVGSKNGKPTITSRNKKIKIEERMDLSETDIEKLNILYCVEYVGIKQDGSKYYKFYDKNKKLKK
ncbi:zinc metalloproteinase nas-13-like [Macrosteles quadrilineatus]|uniref:zinc metalloproteinase nas-13-like n=1 Tax=Macrosteles quadrilineatus TaxID=74068 RepID=UPI0023E18C13|nr:zinc metalloproteinase nas-13-like [Macrosteles quadrilineatus]